MTHIPRSIRPFAACVVALVFTVSTSLASDTDDPPTFADRTDEEVGDTDRRFAFLLDPLAMAVGVFGGEADFVLGRYAALAIEGDLYRRGDMTGEALGAGLAIYPLASALHGLYVEPRIAYA